MGFCFYIEKLALSNSCFIIDSSNHSLVDYNKHAIIILFSIKYGTPHTPQIRLFLRIWSRFLRNSPFLSHIIFWSKHSQYVISLCLRILVNIYEISKCIKLRSFVLSLACSSSVIKAKWNYYMHHYNLRLEYFKYTFEGQK